MAHRSGSGRAAAALLSIALIASNVPMAGAAGAIYGTIQSSGAAWVASNTADWSRLSSARPLAAGDRLRTGSDGYLLADLGEAGVVGLYGDAEVTANDAGSRPMIDVHRGKVAFHLSPESRMMLQAKGAGIKSDTTAADGYVEYGRDGVPVVVVEDGSLNVQVAGVDRKVLRGEQLALSSGSQPEPVRLAEASGESKKAAATATKTGAKTYGGISAAGWTAIAAVTAATGAAIGAGVSDGGHNGSD